MNESMASPYRKSRASNPSGNCVEVGVDQAGRVAVRDTKNTLGPTLKIRPVGWAAFLSTVREANI